MKRPVLAGVAATGLYIAAAVVSGDLSPLNRRPLLEGAGPPPPYRWVAPPPGLASSNKKPEQGRKKVTFQGGASPADVASTGDYQVSVILQHGAIPVQSTAKFATVAVDPVDPSTLAPPPSAQTVAGNAYRVSIALSNGSPVATLSVVSQMQMVYPPAPPSLTGAEHVMLHSADGKTWEELLGNDQPVSQIVLTTALKSLGYFEIVTRKGAATAKKKSSGSGALIFIPVLVAAVGVAGWVALRRRLAVRRRKRKRAAQRARKKR